MYNVLYDNNLPCFGFLALLISRMVATVIQIKTKQDTSPIIISLTGTSVGEGVGIGTGSVTKVKANSFKQLTPHVLIFFHIHFSCVFIVFNELTE